MLLDAASWRYQEVIGAHTCSTAFELTIFPATAGMILFALLGESHSGEAYSLSHKHRLYQSVACGNPGGIREIIDGLGEKELLLAWTLIEVIGRLDVATQPRVSRRKPEENK